MTDEWEENNPQQRQDRRWHHFILTCKYPVSFRLALVSVNAHGRPPRKRNHIKVARLLHLQYLNVQYFSKKYFVIITKESNSSPITPHPPCKIITAFLSLHKDDGFVLFFSHYLLHQLNESANKERAQIRPIMKDYNMLFYCSHIFVGFSHLLSFSVSMQTSTICRMLWLALSSRAPILIWM